MALLSRVQVELHVAYKGACREHGMYSPRVAPHPKQLVGGRDTHLLGRLLYAGGCLVGKAIVTELEKAATKFTYSLFSPSLHTLTYHKLPPPSPSPTHTPSPTTNSQPSSLPYTHTLTHHKLPSLPSLRTHPHSPQAPTPSSPHAHTLTHHIPSLTIHPHSPHTLTYHKLIPTEQPAIGEVDLGEVRARVQRRVVNCHVAPIHLHHCSHFHCLHNLSEDDVPQRPHLLSDDTNVIRKLALRTCSNAIRNTPLMLVSTVSPPIKYTRQIILS